MKRLALLVCLLGVFLSAAFGQESIVRVKVPFEFVAGGQTLPAGSYTFSVSYDAHTTTIRNLDTGKSLTTLYIAQTRFDEQASGRAGISFDVQYGTHFVRAIWPDQGDGYLIHEVKGEHTSETFGAM